MKYSNGLTMPSNLPQAVESCHDLLRWFIPHIDKFPRSRRFTLGERLEAGVLEVLKASSVH